MFTEPLQPPLICSLNPPFTHTQNGPERTRRSHRPRNRQMDMKSVRLQISHTVRSPNVSICQSLIQGTVGVWEGGFFRIRTLETLPKLLSKEPQLSSTVSLCATLSCLHRAICSSAELSGEGQVHHLRCGPSSPTSLARMPRILNIDADTFAVLCLFVGILILDICCWSNPGMFAFFFLKDGFYLFTSVAETLASIPQISPFSPLLHLSWRLFEQTNTHEGPWRARQRDVWLFALVAPVREKVFLRATQRSGAQRGARKTNI